MVDIFKTGTNHEFWFTYLNSARQNTHEFARFVSKRNIF